MDFRGQRKNNLGKALFTTLLGFFLLSLNGCGDIVPVQETMNKDKMPPKVEMKVNVAEDKDQMAEATKDYQEGQYKKALTLLNEVLKRNPSHAQALAAKGYVMALQGEADQGLKYVEKGHELAPYDATIDYQLALVNKIGGHYAKAKYWFGQVLVKDPNNTWSLYGIATIYADEGHGEEAFRYLEKAIATDSSVKAVAREQNHWAPYKNNGKFIEITK